MSAFQYDLATPAGNGGNKRELTAEIKLAIRASLDLDPKVTTAVVTDGFNHAVATDKLDRTVYLTPAGTLATGTLTLPPAASSRVGQIVRVHSTEEITAATVAVSGGGTISGAAVTQFAADTTYAWQCVSLAGAGVWIRI